MSTNIFMDRQSGTKCIYVLYYFMARLLTADPNLNLSELQMLVFTICKLYYK